MYFTFQQTNWYLFPGPIWSKFCPKHFWGGEIKDYSQPFKNYLTSSGYFEGPEVPLKTFCKTYWTYLVQHKSAGFWTFSEMYPFATIRNYKERLKTTFILHFPGVFPPFFRGRILTFCCNFCISEFKTEAIIKFAYSMHGNLILYHIISFKNEKN